MIEIELFGCWGARHIASGTTINRIPHNGAGVSPIPIICRKLRDNGVAVDADTLSITREAKRVFKNDFTLGWWAEKQIRDSPKRRLQWEKFKPYEYEDDE